MEILDIETWKFIAILGAEDIYKLKNDQNFLSIWRYIRSQISEMLKLSDKSVDDIAAIFPHFYMDMWTDCPWAFNTERNGGSLEIRLWALLFPPLPFQLCGGLIHEAHHYEYLRDNDLIGQPNSEQEKHRREMEILAYDKQLRFYKTVEHLIPEEISFIPETNLICNKSEIIEECAVTLQNWKKVPDYASKYEDEIKSIGHGNYQLISEALQIDLNSMERKKGGFQIEFLI